MFIRKLSCIAVFMARRTTVSRGIIRSVTFVALVPLVLVLVLGAAVNGKSMGCIHIVIVPEGGCRVPCRL